jgi:hypothetical protein
MHGPSALGPAYCDFARTFTGCAVGRVVSGRADDIRRAKRYIGRAVQLYVAAGYSQQQAVREVMSYVELE